tara:strand:- start:569 stop:961 length:393 start_codon:yes stop_codon:yes gene_type:complete
MAGSNLDPDMMLKLLHQTHISATTQNPICHHEFPKLNIELSQINDNIINKCIDECYVKYKTTEEGQTRGSVDINPKAWVNFFIFAMIKANNTHGNIQAPNGCSNTDKHAIKKFYEIIYEHFSGLVTKLLT